MLAKFNITRLGKDDIILGLPFFDYLWRTKGRIHFSKRFIHVPETERSKSIDQSLLKHDTPLPPSPDNSIAFDALWDTLYS
jgi:hypothetical protein